MSEAIGPEVGMGIGFEKGFMAYDEPEDLDPSWFGGPPIIAPAVTVEPVIQGLGDVDLNDDSPKGQSLLSWLQLFGYVGHSG